jgi:hypothetical protein
MTYSGPDAGIIKQWESKVGRWVGEGRSREQILYDMTAANWTFADAEQLVRRIVGGQKRKWIIIMIVCGVVLVLELFAFAAAFAGLVRPEGGMFYFLITATSGFIYSLVRLVKIKA